MTEDNPAPPHDPFDKSAEHSADVYYELRVAFDRTPDGGPLRIDQAEYEFDSFTDARDAAEGIKARADYCWYEITAVFRLKLTNDQDAEALARWKRMGGSV